MIRRSPMRFGLAALLISVTLVLASAVLVTRGGAQDSVPTGRTDAASASEVLTSGDLSEVISSLQTRLRRLPADAGSWATLGSAYVQQARITGDPSYYPKAEGAFSRSLEEQPDDNAAALTGRASLAASRHDFATALGLAESALAINPYSPTAMAVKVDALTELGRYPEMLEVLQQMVDLKPSVSSYSRVSYSYELRGDSRGARFAMRETLKVAYSPDDKAFALYQLGELAWNAGDLGEAERLYRKGMAADPTYVPNQYGLAKTLTASDRTSAGLRLWQRVIERLPQPQYLIEYADMLTSLGRADEAAMQGDLLDAQEEILRDAGVDLDLDLALYDAAHGKEREALVQARAAWRDRKSVVVEDVLAWTLHMNGRDRDALRHALSAQRLGTDSALFAFHRGMIQKALGLRPEAIKSLISALDINPSFSPVFAPAARRAVADLRNRR